MASSSTLRWQFLSRFMRATAAPPEQELLIGGEAPGRAATIYLPESHKSSGAAWVLLHGVTLPGRHHAGLRRMARTLASLGQLVLVPEIGPWTALQVSPEETEPALSDALQHLHSRPDVDPDRIGLMGFSVAATWGLEAAAGDLSPAFRAVVTSGAYADLGRMLRAMVIGEHEWRGAVERYRPDPYGRWIVGGALLPMLDDDEWGSAATRQATGGALHRLARTAGRHGAIADQPVYDPLIADLRRSLPAEAWPAWDRLAAPSHTPVPDPTGGRHLAEAMAAAATRHTPMLDTTGRFSALPPGLRVMLLHGRADRLIPYTESLRLSESLPPHVQTRLTLTRLLGHTKRSEAAQLFNPLLISAEVRHFARFAGDLVTALDRDDDW